MTAIRQGPLNRAQIDSVTRQSTDHKQLWENANTALANLQSAVDALKKSSTAAASASSAASSSGGGGGSGGGSTGGVESVSGLIPIVISGTAADPIVGINDFVGDGGTGGVRGAVPKPNPGDKAAGKFLFAGGTWAVPAVPSSSGVLVEVIEQEITSPNPGNFTHAHGLGVTPVLVLLQQQSGGEIWLQTALYDDTNIYLTASGAGLTCIACIFVAGTITTIALSPSAPGNFTVPHGLPNVALAEIQMTSAGEIWFQSTPYDGVNLNLTASAAGLTGNAIVWQTLPSPVIVSSASLSLTPSGPGQFKVAHGLPGVPDLVLIQMRSSGAIWLQSPVFADETYIYFVASAGGIVGQAQVWSNGGGITTGAPSSETAFTSTAGNFSVAHGLGYTPSAAILSMTSLGSVVFQPGLRWDGTNFYLQGSAAGLTGFVEAWK